MLSALSTLVEIIPRDGTLTGEAKARTTQYSNDHYCVISTLACILLVLQLRPTCSSISGQVARFRAPVQSWPSRSNSRPGHVNQESAKASAVFGLDLKNSCDQVEINFQKQLIPMYLQGASK